MMVILQSILFLISLKVIIEVTIVSLAGKTVFEETIAEEEYTKEIDLSGSSSGTYILMITNDQNIVTTKKFIKN